MKWLIILLILLIVIAFIALRYRRHIQTGLQFWRMYRQFKKGGQPAEKKIEQKETDKNAQLVRCARCSKWIPQTDALNLRSKTSYCSTVCMERAARLESLVDKS